MSAEGPLRHHALIVNTSPQVCHEWVRADGADGCWDESNEILGHVIDCVVDLRFGAHLNHLATGIDTSRHFSLFCVFGLLPLFVPLLVFQVQLVLSATLPIHGASLQCGLLLNIVHVVLEFRTCGNLDPIEICLSCSNCLSEPDFAFINVNFIARLVTRFPTVP